MATSTGAELFLDMHCHDREVVELPPLQIVPRLIGKLVLLDVVDDECRQQLVLVRVRGGEFAAVE